MLLKYAAACFCAGLIGLPAAPARAQPETPDRDTRETDNTRDFDRVRVGDLELGGAAPDLRIAKWIQGEPIERFEKGTIYVVDFFASWANPCLETLPYLTRLSEQFPEVRFVSIAAKDLRGETLEKAASFVDSFAGKFRHRAAWDDERRTSDAFMRATGENGLPVSFVVDQNGRVAWIGHPMSEALNPDLKTALRLMLDGKYDVQAAIAARRARDDLRTRAKPYEDALRDAMQKGDNQMVFELADQLVSMSAQEYGQYASMKFIMLFEQVGDYDAGYRYAAWLLNGAFREHVPALTQMAWTILDSPKVQRRDVDMALKLARRANEVSAGKNAEVRHTLARALFEKGDFRRAVDNQTRALDLADEKQRPQAQAALDRYKARAEGKPDPGPLPHTKTPLSPQDSLDGGG